MVGNNTMYDLFLTTIIICNRCNGIYTIKYNDYLIQSRRLATINKIVDILTRNKTLA